MSTEIRKAANYREAFEALVVTYQRRLYLYALSMLHNHEDAEDAVQDTFLRAYRAYEKMDVKPRHDAPLSAWLSKIMLNVVRNRFRKKQLPLIRVGALIDPDFWDGAPEDCLSPDVVLDQDTTFVLIERAIGELPSHLLEAARLRFIRGLTHQQIAKRCSKPIGTVKSHVFRARRLLRHVLQPVLGAA